ncbi:MAG TPA: PorV/PorQ family protein [Rubricoccaceae bacterium]|nr:PorV/PorQ family protein [Rubricoccaceae bacterium]
MRRALLLALGLCAATVQAQGGMVFLAMDPHPIAQGMGGAWAARAEGPLAPLANPAGLATPSGNAAGLTFMDGLAGARAFTLGGRFAAGARGGVGLYVTTLTSGDLEVRDGPGEPAGTFEVQYLAVGAGAARRFGPVQVGVGVKALSERAFEASATGFAVDAGAQAFLLRDGLRLGAALQHLGRMNALDTERSPLPTTVRGGVAVFPFRVVSSTENATLVSTSLSVEGVYRADLDEENTRLRLGGEATLFDLLTLRAGYMTGDPVHAFTAGAGVAVGPFRVDYALLPLDEGFGTDHLIGLRYRW